MIESKRIKREMINFSKYFGVGLFVLVINAFLSWLLIDILKIIALISSAFLGISISLIKYFSYRKVRLIKKRFKLFLTISVISLLMYIGLSGLLIDIFKFNTVITVTALTIALFLGRYLAFHIVGIIKK